ncbi:hypothetical protein GCM10007864_08180 [Sinorhizobium fredii]|nr:hypothetical protein GCM10007864_08180 [Sinorhizobium fredii]
MDLINECHDDVDTLVVDPHGFAEIEDQETTRYVGVMKLSPSIVFGRDDPTLFHPYAER